MATQSPTGPTNVKSSPANNFRSKPPTPSSNIVTAPSKTVVKEPPPLFPPNPLLHELPKPTLPNDAYLLRKSVSIKQLFRSSPFFLQPHQKAKDIERYSDNYLTKEPSLDVSNMIVASSGMFPAELISEKDKKILRTNLLKRKVPDNTAQPITSDELPNHSTKTGTPLLSNNKTARKKSDTAKKTSKTTKRKKGNEMELEGNATPKSKGTTKGKSKKGKDIDTKEKPTPARLSKFTHAISPNRDELDFQALQKLEEQEAKETEENDEQELVNRKKKKLENDIEDEDNELQADMEDADDHLLDEEDVHNLLHNDDAEDDYNDAGGSDGEPYMD